MKIIAPFAPLCLVLCVNLSTAADKQEVKILKEVQWPLPDETIAKVKPGVARSDEELVKLTGDKNASADFAKRFKVDAIDWKKQMVIIVSDGQKPTGGYSVGVTDLKADGKTLIVNWKLKKPDPGSILPQIVTNPGEAVLTDRFEGDIKFDPPLPKGSGSEK
jgi:hypothetical protein